MSEANELVPLDLGTVNVIDIDRDYIYSAFAKQASQKHDKGEWWTFKDFVRQALLTYAAGVR
jgi:hypothetical protein